jgi:hypothetical protein
MIQKAKSTCGGFYESVPIQQAFSEMRSKETGTARD